MKQKFFERIGQWTTPPCIRKSLTSLKALLLLLVMGLSVNVWGDDVTFGSDWNSLFGTSYSGTISGVKANSLTLEGTVSNVSFVVTNGTSTSGYVKTSDFRAYNGYTITITAPTNNNITAISSTKGGKNFSSGVSANVGTLSISNNAISWSGSSNSVVLSCSGTVSFATITVTYSGTTPPTTEPSLSVSPATIDFGTVYQSAEVNPKEVTVTFANLTTNDVAAAISGSAFSINKTGSFTSGNKITITPSTATLGEFEETLTLSATGVDDQKVTITMNVVAAPVLETYNKVTSMDDLAEGDVIVLASSTTAYGVAPGTNKYITSQAFNESSASIAGNVLKAADAYELTLAKSGDNWTMTGADGLVGTTAAKTMTFGSTASGNVTTWSISIDANANASITSTNFSYGTIKYNTSAPRFLNYASGQTAIQIFKKEVPAVYSAITLATCTNGSVSVTGADDLTSVASGTEITLGNTPATGYTLDEYDVYKTGEPATKVTITDGKFKMPAYGVTVSATFKVAKVLNSVEITTPASKTEYWVNEEFSTEGLVLTAHFASGDEVVTPTSITTPDMTTAGEKTITVSFTEGATTKSDEYTIKVKAIANTEETAYTVAEAFALIDVNPTGLATTEVYVKGIVSSIPTPWSSQFNNITYNISDNGETTGQQFQLYRCSTNGAEVGNKVIAKGKMTKFNSTYEFAAGNTIVSIRKAAKLEWSAGAYTAELGLSEYDYPTLTKTPTDLTGVTYSSSKMEVATIDATTGVITLKAEGETTITASFAGDDNYDAAEDATYILTVAAEVQRFTITYNSNGGSEIAPVENQTNLPATFPTPTKDWKVFGGWYLDNETFENPAVANAPLTDNTTLFAKWNDPLSVAEMIALIPKKDDNVSNIYGYGFIKKVDNVNSGAATYWITDGTNDFEVYKGKNINNANFTDASELPVGNKVMIFGNIKNFYGTPEFDANNYLLQNEAVTTPSAATPTITPSAEAETYWEPITVTLATETAGAAIYYTTNGDAPTTASTLYENPINVEATTTIKAIAVKEGLDNSEVASKTFNFGKVFADIAACFADGTLQNNDVVKITNVSAVITSFAQSGKTVYYEGGSFYVNATYPQTYAIGGTLSGSNLQFTYMNYNPKQLRPANWDALTYTAPAQPKEQGTITATYKTKLDVDAANDVYEVTYNGDGELSVESSDPTVATASLEGTTVTIDPLKAGTTTITISAPATDNFTEVSKSYTLTVNPAPAAATPTITPSTEVETYWEPITVTLATETAGAAIYYTTNGDAPTTASTLYENPINVEATTTIKAIAVKEGLDNSEVAEKEFKFGKVFDDIAACFADETLQNGDMVKISNVSAVITSFAYSGKTVYYEGGSFYVNATYPQTYAIGGTLSGSDLQFTYMNYDPKQLRPTSWEALTYTAPEPEPEPDFVLEGKAAGALATICLPKKIARVENATLFSISHGNTQQIEFVEVSDFSEELAGMPYLVEVTEAGSVKFFTEGEAVQDPVSPAEANGFVGSLQDEKQAVPVGSILISGGMLHTAGADCWLTKNHAYIDAIVLPSEAPVTSAPGRRLVLTNAEAQVITGLNAIQVSGKTRKMMINNQMVIIREGKMYNATGALMK